MTFTVVSDLNGDSPQFNLTCTSTGGPATTVTWTRDSETVSGGVTVLDDPVTAQYTHTLTVTGRLGGQYQCTMANSRPSSATTTFTVQGTTTMAILINLLLLLLLLLPFSFSPSPSSFPSSSSSSSSSSFVFLPLLLSLLLQLPQLQLTSLQSRKVPLVYKSLGPHPLHWGIQLGTGSIIVVAAVTVWMSVVAPHTTTY